mmetsp:Transcript_2392/g.5901  ORF Transcript_2392/g.5901 Transcript_2392/m.5901 type:complete len:208 (+) Transcript_2392:3046-3669(+)
MAVCWYDVMTMSFCKDIPSFDTIALAKLGMEIPLTKSFLVACTPLEPCSDLIWIVFLADLFRLALTGEGGDGLHVALGFLSRALFSPLHPSSITPRVVPLITYNFAINEERSLGDMFCPISFATYAVESERNARMLGCLCWRSSTKIILAADSCTHRNHPLSSNSLQTGHKVSALPSALFCPDGPHHAQPKQGRGSGDRTSGLRLTI